MVEFSKRFAPRVEPGHPWNLGRLATLTGGLPQPSNETMTAWERKARKIEKNLMGKTTYADTKKKI